jgi:thiol-disulfide isomerase/thioredoxin
MVLIGVGVLGYYIINWWLLHRAGRNEIGFETYIQGLPAVLYFTMPDCIPCKTIQQPALAQLEAEIGEKVQVIQVDVTERPELAEYWGVLSVPTTFIIDSDGEPRKVNHGAVLMEKLLGQLEAVEGRSLQKPEKREYNELNSLES